MFWLTDPQFESSRVGFCYLFFKTLIIALYKYPPILFFYFLQPSPSPNFCFSLPFMLQRLLILIFLFFFFFFLSLSPMVLSSATLYPSHFKMDNSQANLVHVDMMGICACTDAVKFAKHFRKFRNIFAT